MTAEHIKYFALQDAVRAYIQQTRAFSEHWTYYTSPEQRALFSNNVALFAAECRKLYRDMTA